MLAAFEAWESLNTIVTVYDETGEIYCGRYSHSGNEDLYGEAVQKAYYEGRILPLGQDNHYFGWDRFSGEMYLEETDTVIRSLELEDANLAKTGTFVL